MKFSQKKFSDFTDKRKNRILIRFIREIENNWRNLGKRQSLLMEFGNCLAWSDHLSPLWNRKQISEDLSQREFLELIVPLEQHLSRDVRDRDILVLKEDGAGVRGEMLPLVVLLHNLRSAFNVGSIFRTAECLQVEKIYISGYTATPDNPRLQETAMGTEKKVVWEKIDDPVLLLGELKCNGYQIYALETALTAESIHEADLKFPCCLILGNEALGIDDLLLEKADRILKIPVRGWKNSLNVGTAFAVCGYEILRRQKRT